MKTDESELGKLLEKAFSAEVDEGQWLAVQSKLKDSLKAAKDNSLWLDQFSLEPLGKIWIAVSQRGLMALRFGGSQTDLKSALQKKQVFQFLPAAKETEEVKQALLAYLSGETDRFDLALDDRLMTAFQRTVLQATLQIPRGQVRSYAQIAQQVGCPKGPRAVGQALRTNPLPIVLPCHRVITSDGKLGGYAGERNGPKKRFLLQLEGALLA